MRLVARRVLLVSIAAKVVYVSQFQGQGLSRGHGIIICTILMV